MVPDLGTELQEFGLTTTTVSDTIIDMVESAVILAFAEGENLLTDKEAAALETILGTIQEIWPDYVDYFFPEPDDGDECFDDEYGWSPEDE